MANVLTLRETKRSRTWGSYGLTRSGQRVNKSLYDAVQMAAFLADWGPVYWVQGGINAGKVAASAATHSGLGVGDLSVRTRPGGAYKRISAIKKFVTWLGRCGVTAFIRGFVDRMTKHLHCVQNSGTQMHWSTKAQIFNRRYGSKYGGAGLAGAPWARWWGPKREKLITWAQSKYNPKNKRKPFKAGWYSVDGTKVKKGLVGLSSKGKRKFVRPPGTRLYIVKLVHARINKARTDEIYGVTKYGTYYNIGYLNRSKKQ